MFKIGLKLKSLDEAKEIYGEDRLVAISYLKQIIHHTAHGCQPVWVGESEKEGGKLVAWFLKEESRYINKLWKETLNR